MKLTAALFAFGVLLVPSQAEVLGGVDVAALLTTFQKLNLFSDGINGADHVKDTVLYGRAIRITDNGGCVTVQDRATSFKTTKCANTSEEATAEGTSELFTLLIKIGQMSYDDVGLKPPTPKPVEKNCADNFSENKCQLHIKLGHCDPNDQFFNWIHHNCYKSCGGCLSKEEIQEALSFNKQT